MDAWKKKGFADDVSLARGVQISSGSLRILLVHSLRYQSLESMDFGGF